jgi:hypothetical protein
MSALRYNALRGFHLYHFLAELNSVIQLKNIPTLFCIFSILLQFSSDVICTKLGKLRVVGNNSFNLK